MISRVLLRCDRRKGLREHRDDGTVFSHLRNNLCRFRCKGHITICNTILFQKIIQRIFRCRALSCCNNRLSGKILHRLYRIIRTQAINHAKCVDINDRNATLGLVVKNRCKICRYQCNVKISAGNRRDDRIRLRLHIKSKLAERTVIRCILFKMQKSDGCRAF